MINNFRKVAFWEGVSFLVLMVNMILKKSFVDLGLTMAIGYGHGLLFVAYCILLIFVAQQYKWSFKIVALAFLASLLPFGTFIADKRIFSQYANA